VTRPDYIARGGDLVMAPPLQLRSTTMYSFLVDADLAALTALCDAQLNAVTGPGRVYKPLLPAVAIVCADVTDSFSLTPPDSQKGWMSERDFGIWVPVIANGTIGWYLPYVFVDNVAAMVTGREVYGFFKQTAALAMPPAPDAPGMFSVDALAIPRFSPASQAEVVRLLTMTSVERSAAPAGRWSSARDALAAMWSSLEQLHRTVDGATVSSWELVKNGLEELATGDVPLVFLKQFRDASDPTKACYQAVLEAPAHLEAWHGGWFTHPHDIVLATTDSHPIAKDCGLGAGTLRSRLGFWCRIDFVMKEGEVVAER
jgi:hypothetical protein